MHPKLFAGMGAGSSHERVALPYCHWLFKLGSKILCFGSVASFGKLHVRANNPG